MEPHLHPRDHGVYRPPTIVDEFSDQIGGRLQEAREQAGLTWDDVQFRTRIPKSVIEALEAGNFSVFASPTYAKSFLAQYSGFLKVEADLWLDALEPASFISGDHVTPLWATANLKPEDRVQAPVGADGRLSAVSLLVLTCGLVFVAIKGYQFFDQRLGAGTSPAVQVDSEEKLKVAPKPQVPPPARATPEERKAPVEEPGTQPESSTPRAVIVK
jgi:cytoskeletal protein RodZ